jgi:hypothetical protein
MANRKPTTPAERAWNAFKRDLRINRKAAYARLGLFEMNEERVRWMLAKGDSLRAEFYAVAARGQAELDKKADSAD